MISHEQALSQFDAYFGNRLERGAVRDFHAHISDCDECQVRLRTMNAMAPKPGFTRGEGAAAEAKLQGILRKNRIIMYAVLAILLCFFFLFLAKRK